MSSRTSTRTRAKSARALEAEASEASATSTPVAAPAAKKRSSRARAATPASRSSSRAQSPISERRASGRRRPSTQQQPQTPRSTPKSRGSGSATPLSRHSRSSSVASNGQKSASKASKASSSAKSGSNNKGGRGYDPGRVNYKESEYHYGSDFEEDEDEVELDDAESEKSDESSEEEEDSFDSDDLRESDVDLDDLEPISRPQTPVPFWLRGESEEAVPDLVLPKSSEDLLVSSEHILDVFSVYEILRRFHQILRLTPFRVEDLCAALASPEQSNLLSEVHMALLKLLLRAEESAGSNFGGLDQKDSINSVFYFMDSVTWPECLRSFLQSDPAAYAEALDLLRDSEYPFAGPQEAPDQTLFVERRVKMLRFLAAQILTTSTLREFITDGKSLPNEEHCRVCFRLGKKHFHCRRKFSKVSSYFLNISTLIVYLFCDGKGAKF